MLLGRKGGSGDGPNPVQYLVVSLTSCHQETAALIAKEKGIEKVCHMHWYRPRSVSVQSFIFQWGPIEFHTKFELNTDGFLGLVSSTLHAYDVFQRVVLNAEVTADVTQDTINEVYHAVKARCPLRALFESAGVRIEGVWKKKVAVMENE